MEIETRGTQAPTENCFKPSSSSASDIVVIPVSLKRPAESELAEDDLKKKKKKTHGENNEKIDPKKLFERRWSEEDELVILEGRLEWHERGDDPLKKDLVGLHDSIKEYLIVAATTYQLGTKLKRLKKKYQNNFNRGKRGLDPSFSKPHDSKCYQLMKVIWDGQEGSSRRIRIAPAADNGNEGSSKGKKKRRKKVQESESSSNPFLAAAIKDGRTSAAGGELEGRLAFAGRFNG